MLLDWLQCCLEVDEVKFSIIIPCYKVERYIRECLDSVLAQDYADWEAICVDDGSPDKTGKILDEYASGDSRIKVIHQENGGLSAARNVALKVAQGVWLYYLDSDDLMPSNVLAKVHHDVVAHPDADMLWGMLSRFKDGLEPKWNSGSSPSVEVDVSDTFFFRHFSTYFPTFFFKRSVFGDIPFVGASWCEERPYVAKCMVRAQKIVEVSYSTYGFRERAGSITHTRMKLEHCTGYLDATREILKILSSSGKPAAWRYWFNSLKEISEYDFAATTWRRFVISACCAIPARPTAWLLCYLPDWLKRRGLHR